MAFGARVLKYWVLGISGYPKSYFESLHDSEHIPELMTFGSFGEPGLGAGARARCRDRGRGSGPWDGGGSKETVGASHTQGGQYVLILDV